MIFSIIVPVYNKASCISTTLDSVMAQTFIDFEIIIVDDGSKDDSVAVIQQFTDSRIRLIQQANAGVSAARNAGIAAAKGKWVAFLDADDWWHPNYLATLANLAIRYPNAQALATNYQSLADNDNWQPSNCNELNQPGQVEIITNLPKAWLKNHSFFTSSLAIQKVLLDALQPCFREGETQGEDLDVWFRVAEQTSIYVYHSKLVVYRTGQENSLASTQQLSKVPPFMGRIQQSTIYRNHAEYRQAVDEFIQNALLFNARKLFFKQHRINALQLTIKAYKPINIKWLVYFFTFLMLPLSLAKKILLRR